MSAKIIAIAAATMLFASSGLASARTAPLAVHSQDPYAGTVWDGVAPYNSGAMPDPYAGSIWDGVAPY